MRVIAGTHRGRRLRAPHGDALRPTSDRVREALFSILGNRIPESCFLDLYAGTGAVGIEAVSRGARRVTCVESNAEALGLLRDNFAACGVTTQLTTHAQTVQQFLKRPQQWAGPYDIVFADPPYHMTHELPALLEQAGLEHLLSPDAWLVIEHDKKTALPARIGVCTLRRQYGYGDTMLSIFSNASATPS